jgi:hypothetical protein
MFIGVRGFCQKGKLNLSDSCSNIAELVSYYWKLDSLANNGFRLYAYNRILNCKIDKLSVSYLLDKLGKPNKVSKTNQGTQFVYYYYDSKAIPSEKNRPFECGYIYFLFDDKKSMLTSIGEGVLDY